MAAKRKVDIRSRRQAYRGRYRIEVLPRCLHVIVPERSLDA